MSYWTEKIIIGGRAFPRFIGGPLDGITDSPFRQLVRQFSRDELLFTEMRHAGAIASEKGERIALRYQSNERPLNFQIAANKVDFLELTCQKIMQKGADIVDLNIGCPAPAVIRSGSGSALMADIPRLKTIVQALRAYLPIPLTVKIRAGFKCSNAIEVSKLLQDCGVDAITIHPRLQTKKFEGKPDYDLARQVKQAVSIPVIISGGVVNWATAKMVYEATGVDGFLIARGMWAKPWKLLELKEHSQGRAFTIDKPTIMRYALQHLDGMLSYYGDHGLYVYRKHLPFYIKGLPNASALRQSLVTSSCVNEVKEGIANFLG